MSLISQAELARLLGAAKSTVCDLIKKGLPTNESGALDQKEALEWIVKYRSGIRGGWAGPLRSKDSLQNRAKGLLRKMAEEPPNHRTETLDSEPQKPAEEPERPQLTQFDRGSPEYLQIVYDQGHRRGMIKAAHGLCSSVRTSLAPLFAGILNTDLRSEEKRLRVSVGILALTTVLIEGWCEELLEEGRRTRDFDELPQIPWREIYEGRADEAKAIYEEVTAYLRGNGE